MVLLLLFAGSIVGSAMLCRWDVVALNLADAVLWWGLFMVVLAAWFRFFPSTDVPKEAVKGVAAMVPMFLLVAASTAAAFLLVRDLESNLDPVTMVFVLFVVLCLLLPLLLWFFAIRLFRQFCGAIVRRHGVPIGFWMLWRKALGAFVVAFAVGTMSWMSINGLLMGGVSHWWRFHIAEGGPRDGDSVRSCVVCRLEAHKAARMARSYQERARPWRPHNGRFKRSEFSD